MHNWMTECAKSKALYEIKESCPKCYGRIREKQLVANDITPDIKILGKCCNNIIELKYTYEEYLGNYRRILTDIRVHDANTR